MLAELIYRERDVWTGEGAILEGSHHLAILSRINKWLSIKVGQLGTCGTRGDRRFGTQHASSVKDISNVFSLRKVQTSRRTCDLNAEEKSQITQIFQWELLL